MGNLIRLYAPKMSVNECCDWIGRRYLFWIVNEGSKRGGLYRVDLADLNDGPLSARDESSRKIQRIFHHRNLGAFKVDYSNSRVFLINPEDETVTAISLNG